MKGIIIYEDYRGKEVVEAIKLGMVNYECKSDTSDGNWINNLSGVRKESTQACCDKSDTYDFETGALIALMKMCGVEKVKKAAKETFFDVAENSVNEYEEKIHALEKENNYLKYIKSCNESTIKSLENSRDLLNNESMNRLKDKLNLKEKYVALMAENEKLKLDCEKLQHGYIDTDMIFCGGRQNGKQYTFLVELFKKIPKDKVQAAYIAAYKESLIWCTSQPSIRDQLDSLLESSKYAIPYTTEWTKSPTKREEMWAEIFVIHKENDVVIKVKKEDVNTFLHEIEKRIPEITWLSGVKIFETKYTIKDIYDGLKTRDEVYFRLRKENTLSYSSDPDIYQYKDLKHIDYLPPMRWDLFKKGRRIIRVTPDKLDEFMKKCSIKLGGIISPNLKRYKEFTHVFVMISDYHYDNKATVHIMTSEDLVRNQHENPKKYSDKKIVDWEDVR